MSDQYRTTDLIQGKVLAALPWEGGRKTEAVARSASLDEDIVRRALEDLVRRGMVDSVHGDGGNSGQAGGGHRASELGWICESHQQA
jgi:predicted transcriptional regulator